MGQKKRNLAVVISTVFIILILGIIFIGGVIFLENRAMRDELLLDARLIEKALNIQSPLGLSGSNQDLGSPLYQSLKQKFSAICAVYPECRFIYLFGKRPDGKIFFFLDSESPDSSGYSPPGQIYNEATEAVVGIFSTGKEIFEGPETDRWGTWISALTPVTEPKTGKVIAVLGMDIDVRNWSKIIFLRAFSSLILFLMACALVGIFLYLQHKGKQENLHLKAIQSALQDSEQKYHNLFLAFPDAMVVFDPANWKFYSGNPAMLKMFGLRDEKQLLSLRPDELFPERQPDGSFSVKKVRETVDIALRQGSALFEWMHRRLNGQEFPSSVLLTKMESGSEVLLQILIRDITQNKKIEEENLKHMQELEVFYKVSMGREERIIELKQEIEELKRQLQK